MSYSAVILFNNKNSLAAVDYSPVTDAFLSGGVFFDEVTFLAYDVPAALDSALVRLAAQHDGVFIVCDSVLVPEAKRAVEIASGERFANSSLLETKKNIFGVLPAGMGGAKLVSSELIPRIDGRRKQSYYRVVLRAMSPPAKTVKDLVEEIHTRFPQLMLHVTEKYADARVEIIYDRNTPKYVVDEASRMLATGLERYLYAVEDVPVAERLVDALKIRRRRISVAESFTGGGVGRAIVRIPGASEVYFEGINAYNGKAKETRLQVAPFTIERRGTVSDRTAYEMAAGLLATGECDLAVATTGVAGPASDEKGNPAGLCYIAAGTREEVHVYRYDLSGDRETVTETAINLALFLAFRELQ